jgi:hypothetical protein
VKREIIVSSFWLTFAFFLGVESYRLGLSTANRPGPGFFPFVAAAGMGLLAIFRLAGSTRKSLTDDLELGFANDAGLVLYVIAGMIAYAFLLDLLGFPLCTFLLIAFYLKVIAARSWGAALSYAAVVALASHAFFDLLLRAELPRGVLGSLL